MSLDAGEFLTAWTVRLAVACYLTRVAVDLHSAGRPGARSQAFIRWCWTAGCALYLVHVACAFGFYHDWSHAAAYRHTAAQTAALTGIDSGAGLYVNYAFTLFWLGDVVLSWRAAAADRPAPAYRSRTYFWLLHAVFAFLVFNATVVFGPPAWRWAAFPIATALLAAFLTRNRAAAG